MLEARLDDHGPGFPHDALARPVRCLDGEVGSGDDPARGIPGGRRDQTQTRGEFFVLHGPALHPEPPAALMAG